jgi:beta-xylosidase
MLAVWVVIAALSVEQVKRDGHLPTGKRALGKWKDFEKCVNDGLARSKWTEILRMFRRPVSARPSWMAVKGLRRIAGITTTTREVLKTVCLSMTKK